MSIDSGDSLSIIAKQVRHGAKVLELGVASGYFGRFLVEQLDCIVDGIEIDPLMAEIARRYYRKLIIGDLENISLSDQIDTDYNYIICADILEHLKEPSQVLENLKSFLKRDGEILISIPNIAYAGAVIAIISGDFPYRDEGLLDKSHLRFFTLKSFLRMLIELKYDVKRIEKVHLSFEESEFAYMISEIDPQIRKYLFGIPDSDVYQYVLAVGLYDSANGFFNPRSKLSVYPEEEKIDVIIPVYKGEIETKRCIESVLSYEQNAPFEVIVIDDNSPDMFIYEYLSNLASKDLITFIYNSQNLGFVASVNSAMLLHNKRDVIILNSDTIVSNDWIDRLRRCALSDPAIGTVTPFSNNATICSYPNFCEDNELPEGLSVEYLDNLFKKINSCKMIDIPTGVGFCMYIKRSCLNDVGMFDFKNFGKGYGEENDFCMRASRSGWRHVLCGDVFVYHKGGVSFSGTKKELQQRGIETLVKLHPDYLDIIRSHLEADPAKDLRSAIDTAIVKNKNNFLLNKYRGFLNRLFGSKL
ncbi:MAG: glycosyltransferase [Dissulfurimicrobium sp.]|uniref:glycosyltransferase n=1 Tax=Dissulfurimicrobium TaxID=1769732 RepID=UPI001EDA355C|nr:glycosyltransferase [Dissulfurimicrobium hydrothermale]UKL14396.1 glycosyltransferase [Dissulfurimicrobium hydrothermale]